MEEGHGYRGTQVLLAFLGGAATGAAIVILAAPKSGRETREQLGDYVDSGKEYLHSHKEKTKRLPEAMRSARGAAREAFSETMRHAGH